MAMQIRGPNPPASTGTPVSPAAAVAEPGAARGWRSGQILQATVTPHPQTGAPLLSIDGQPLLVADARRLQIGQTLRLQVLRAEQAALLRLPDEAGGKTAPPLRLPPPATGAWRSGQQLPVRAILQRPDAPALRLPDGREVPVRLPVASLRHGQTLRLQVLEPGHNAILRVLGTTDDAATRLRLLRDALPRQQALGEVFGQLLTALRENRELPPALRRPLQDLLARLPGGESLDGDGLRRAIADSGLFLEARLAAALRDGLPPDETGRLLGKDLKGGLLALLARLLGLGAGNAPVTVPERPARQDGRQARPASRDTSEVLGALRRETEGALARLQLAQLDSLPEDDAGRRWLLELPLRSGKHIESARLRIEEEKHGGKDDERQWRAGVTLEPGELGTVHAEIGLRGVTVSVRFLAERPETVARIQAHRGELQRRLQAAGLHVGPLLAEQGTVSEPLATPPHPLLDEQA